MRHGKELSTSMRSMRNMPIVASAAPAIPPELEKMIRTTSSRVDKLAEEQKIIFQKVTEMYKIVLKGSGSVG